MSEPILQGNWRVAWERFSDADTPRSLDAFLYAKSPAFFGSGKVDDVSAHHDDSGVFCPDGILRFLPFGDPSSGINTMTRDGDIVVYITKKPPSPTQGSITALKQRGWHAEICYKIKGTTQQASVWRDGIKDRPIDDLPKEIFMHIFRLHGPSGPAHECAAFSKSIRMWRQVYDNFNPAAAGQEWNLDPADFSDVDSLRTIAIRLLNRKPGSKPSIPATTCVQWVYTILSLALTYPLTEETLDALGAQDIYEENWRTVTGTPLPNNSPVLTNIPFRPYSLAEVIQEFLNTYCDGLSLLSLISGERTPHAGRITELITDAVPPRFRSIISEYITELSRSKDLALPLISAPHGFIMPISFYCEERRLRNTQTSCYFQYVGTGVHKNYIVSK